MLTPAYNNSYGSSLWILGIEEYFSWNEGALRDKTGAARLGNFRAKGWAYSARGLVRCRCGVNCLEAINLAGDWSDLRSCILLRNVHCFRCGVLLLSRLVIQEKAG